MFNFKNSWPIGDFSNNAIVSKCIWSPFFSTFVYSHLSNKRGAWNKRGGGSKFAKLLNVEVGINVEAGIF